jgi:hypothetical protein
MSSTTSPVLPGNAAVSCGSAATSRSVNSPGSSVIPPALTVPSPACSHSPALTARMTFWVSPPSRGPHARALTAISNRPYAPTSVLSTTSLTLTSSPRMSANGASVSASGAATVSRASGRRTRRPRALRTDSAAEATCRTRSIAATSSASRGSNPPSGQSVRCTDRPPVSPCQIVSVVSGSSGAATRQVTSSTVCSVSIASGSPAQNRSRDRRTYQLVSVSTWSRTRSQAPAMS